MSLFSFKHLLRGLLSLFCAAAGITAAGAADIKVIQTEDRDMQIIVFSGEIEPGDEKRFANLAIQTSSAIVVLNSAGGAIVPAIEIGKTIRIKGFQTYVAERNLCTSACALVWLGGRQRSMSARALIGFHAAYTVSQGFASVNGPGNALVGAYLSQLGLPDAAVVYITSAPPDKMLWLTPDAAKVVGLEIRLVDIPAEPSASSGGYQAKMSPPGAAQQAIPLEEQAQSFVTEVLALDASNEPASMAAVSRRYADFVFYYGKYVPKSAVTKEHEGFVSRWPKRSQLIKPGTLRIQCQQFTGKCQVSALIEWVAESEPRNARSTGTSSWALEFDRSSDGFKISAISGKVLDRHLSELRSKGLGCLLGAC